MRPAAPCTSSSHTSQRRNPLKSTVRASAHAIRPIGSPPVIYPSAETKTCPQPLMTLPVISGQHTSIKVKLAFTLDIFLKPFHALRRIRCRFVPLLLLALPARTFLNRQLLHEVSQVCPVTALALCCKWSTI